MIGLSDRLEITQVADFLQRPKTFLTPRIRKPKGGVVDADFDPNGWLRNYFLKSEIDWLKHGIPYKKKPWSEPHPD